MKYSAAHQERISDLLVLHFIGARCSDCAVAFALKRRKTWCFSDKTDQVQLIRAKLVAPNFVS